MDPRAVVEFQIFIGEKNCALGTFQCQKGCTYADMCCEIVNNEIVEYPFDFIIGSIGFPLNAKQEKKGNLQQIYSLRGQYALWLLKHWNQM